MPKTTKKGHGLFGAVLSAVLVAGAALLVSAGLLAVFLELEGRGGAIISAVMVVYVLAYAAVAVGVIAALVQRWKEVGKGEEDEAKKY